MPKPAPINFHTDVQSCFAHYLACLDGEYRGRNRWLQGQTQSFLSARNGDDFYYVSAETMRGYISRGYVVPGVEAPRGRKTNLRRKMTWAEEGDLDVDSALNGDDFPFRAFSERRRLPGLRIDVEMGFRAISDPRILEAYAAWISRLIYGLEDRGYKMDVNVVSRCEVSTYGGHKRAVNVHIKCQTAGKRTDFKAWSAMLSPGGFRHLIFAARGLAGDSAGVDIRGVGGSVFEGWRVAYDQRQRMITVGCHSHAMDFPAEEMDRQLAEVFVQI